MRFPVLSSESHATGSAGRRAATGVVMGALGIAVVTVVIAVLKRWVDPSSVTGLYLFAILPVAIGRGFWLSAATALAAYLTYEFFFVPPIHSLVIAQFEDGFALGIALVTAYVVSELAREAREAQAAERRLAEEQAALRRVATLVAQGVPTGGIFEAVTREVGLLCDADLARMERFEDDDAVTALAAWAREDREQLAVGTRLALEGASIAIQVRETGRPARVDSFLGATGPIAREAQRLGIRASIGCPITVDGRLWGVIAASTTRAGAFPADTESRIADFTELVATAISNAEARAGLVASRARLLTAADEARRRVVRDLHDGAQQRLVHTVITVGLAERALEHGEAGAPGLVSEAMGHARGALEELRHLSHGILPADLTRGGLRAGVDAVAERLALPVEVDVPAQRLRRCRPSESPSSPSKRSRRAWRRAAASRRRQSPGPPARRSDRPRCACRRRSHAARR
jgi:GAF domain-containing protein